MYKITKLKIEEELHVRTFKYLHPCTHVTCNVHVHMYVSTVRYTVTRKEADFVHTPRAHLAKPAVIAHVYSSHSSLFCFTPFNSVFFTEI